MEDSILQNSLPIALGIIMFGIGLHLTPKDFTRFLKNPKPILIGLFVQSIILPFLCFLLAKYSNLSNELAVGLMLLAASPGGITANLYSHLFKGDVALNISLTAINSVFIIVTMPVIVNFSIHYFMESETQLSLQFSKIVEVVAIVILPVLLGMYMNTKFPNLAAKFEKFVKVLSALILLFLIVAIVVKEKESISNYFGMVGVVTLVFCLISIGIGYSAGKFFRLKNTESKALAFEIGIHNSTLSIYLAISVLNNNMMSIPSAVYSIWMFPIAALFGFLVSKIAKN